MDGDYVLALLPAPAIIQLRNEDWHGVAVEWSGARGGGKPEEVELLCP